MSNTPLLLAGPLASTALSDYLYFLLLGAVQGITEFLPISSSGHLILLENLSGFNPPGVVAEVALHLATLIAVIIYYRKEVLGLITLRSGAYIEKPARYLLVLVVVTLITVLAIYPFRGQVVFLTEGKASLINLAITFLFTATLLSIIDLKLKGETIGLSSASKLSLISLAFVGLMQALAVLPGVSRSGSTIFAGIICGLKREEAARFAFLLFIYSCSDLAI